MKLRIDGYEVEVNAKSEYSDSFNQRDTKALLNILSIALFSSSEYHKSVGCEYISAEHAKMSNDIYRYLDEKNYYHL